jgi:hypothetical protein
VLCYSRKSSRKTTIKIPKKPIRRGTNAFKKAFKDKKERKIKLEKFMEMLLKKSASMKKIKNKSLSKKPFCPTSIRCGPVKLKKLKMTKSDVTKLIKSFRSRKLNKKMKPPVRKMASKPLSRRPIRKQSSKPKNNNPLKHNTIKQNTSL